MSSEDRVKIINNLTALCDDKKIVIKVMKSYLTSILKTDTEDELSDIDKFHTLLENILHITSSYNNINNDNYIENFNIQDMIIDIIEILIELRKFNDSSIEINYYEREIIKIKKQYEEIKLYIDGENIKLNIPSNPNSLYYKLDYLLQTSHHLPFFDRDVILKLVFERTKKAKKPIKDIREKRIIYNTMLNFKIKIQNSENFKTLSEDKRKNFFLKLDDFLKQLEE